MSHGGRSGRVAFLREAIARIEAGQVSGLTVPCGQHGLGEVGDRRAQKIPLGGAGDAACIFDAALGGGLERNALHEIVAARPGDAAAASGFALALAARFSAPACVPSPARGRRWHGAAVPDEGSRAWSGAGPHPPGKAGHLLPEGEGEDRPILWVIEDFATLETGAPYGPGLAAHGLAPDRLVLVNTAKPQETLWVMEEALRAKAVAAVLGELWNVTRDYDLTESRRLLLAARAGGTPCLLLHAGAAGQGGLLSSAADTRFEVRTCVSGREPAAGGLPLPGLCTWSVRLVKARAGPGLNFDRDRSFDLVWDPAERCLRDYSPSVSTLPLPVHRPAVSSNRAHRTTKERQWQASA